MPTSKIDEPTAARLQAVLDLLVEQGAPDAIAAVITPNGTWTGAAGIDGPNNRPATPNDEFAIASISKGFTAAVIMRLVEQGKINLDEPLASYLDGIDANTNHATVRQALAMKGGIGDSTQAAGDQIYTDPTRVWTVPEIVALIGDPLTAPGIAYHYSNPSYKYLGMAAERVTGKSEAAAMAEAVLDPVCADRILLQDPQHLTPQPWALQLKDFEGLLDVASYGKGDALPCMSDATFSRNAAGMASDAASLARWGWLLFSGQILQPDSLTTMMTFNSDGHGLAVDTIPDFGPTAFGLSGHKSGYASLLAVLPDRNTVLVLFVNNADADLFAGAQKLIKAL